MLWKLLGVMLVLWFIGFVARIGGFYIHLLLLIAGTLFVIQVISSRKAT